MKFNQVIPLSTEVSLQIDESSLLQVPSPRPKGTAIPDVAIQKKFQPFVDPRQSTKANMKNLALEYLLGSKRKGINDFKNFLALNLDYHSHKRVYQRYLQIRSAARVKKTMHALDSEPTPSHSFDIAPAAIATTERDQANDRVTCNQNRNNQKLDGNMGLDIFPVDFFVCQKKKVHSSLESGGIKGVIACSQCDGMWSTSVIFIGNNTGKET